VRLLLLLRALQLGMLEPQQQLLLRMVQQGQMEVGMLLQPPQQEQ
jgi:hypothetical protein